MGVTIFCDRLTAGTDATFTHPPCREEEAEVAAAGTSPGRSGAVSELPDWQARTSLARNTSCQLGLLSGTPLRRNAR